MAVITRFLPGGNDASTGPGTISDAGMRGYPANFSTVGLTKVKTFENTFSLDAITTGPAARAATSVGAGDTIQLISIPKNHLVLGIRFESMAPSSTSSVLTFVTTPVTVTRTYVNNTLTITKTPGSDSALTLSAINANAAAGTQVTNTTPTLYTSDETYISLASASAISTGGYRIVVLAVDLTGQDDFAKVAAG
jgi:hypothetical protein